MKLGTSHRVSVKKSSCFVVFKTSNLCPALFLQGADFVEFDVQLSKDNIPVVYHDFKVGLSLKKVTLTFDLVTFLHIRQFDSSN